MVFNLIYQFDGEPIKKLLFKIPADSLIRFFGPNTDTPEKLNPNRIPLRKSKIVFRCGLCFYAEILISNNINYFIAHFPLFIINLVQKLQSVKV